jgi:hypothetical protein
MLLSDCIFLVMLFVVAEKMGRKKRNWKFEFCNIDGMKQEKQYSVLNLASKIKLGLLSCKVHRLFLTLKLDV